MVVRSVLKAGHPDVRNPSEPVSSDQIGSEGLQRLIRDMIDTMRDRDGVGLAAPQVQSQLRILVYEIRPNPRYPDIDSHVGPRVLINPEIVETGDKTVEEWEGCLTFPDLRGRVPRFHQLSFRAVDENGDPIEQTVDGFEARVIQHEIDHLDGTLFVERIDDMSTLCYDETYHRYHTDDDPDDS